MDKRTDDFLVSKQYSEAKQDYVKLEKYAVVGISVNPCNQFLVFGKRCLRFAWFNTIAPDLIYPDFNL